MGKIYVCCPGYVATGGTELLHQLVYKINKIKSDAAVIYYSNFSEEKGNPTPEIYNKYIGSDFVTQVDDDKNAVLVLPEILARKIIDFKNIKIVMWWLSVDNHITKYENSTAIKVKSFDSYFTTLKTTVYCYLKRIPREVTFERKQLFSNNVILHLYQSEYAKLFLQDMKLKPLLSLSDFLNATFFLDECTPFDRQNIILYNPQKGFEITQELIRFMPDYKWVPLEKLTPIEMKNLLQTSKIYIDFGNHPGKDRIPREAAINGCVVITNKEGSAKNSIDVPIVTDYKIENPIEDKEVFFALVSNIFLDFDTHFSKFNIYREKIKNEEKIFEEDVTHFYKYLEATVL